MLVVNLQRVKRRRFVLIYAATAVLTWGKQRVCCGWCIVRREGGVRICLVALYHFPFEYYILHFHFSYFVYFLIDAGIAWSGWGEGVRSCFQVVLLLLVLLFFGVKSLPILAC